MTPTQKNKAINDKAILRLEKFAKTNWGVTDIDLKNLDARAISKTFKEMNKIYKGCYLNVRKNQITTSEICC